MSKGVGYEADEARISHFYKWERFKSLLVENRGEDDRIEISTSHSLDTQKCALVHEILHGIDEMYKLGLKESQVEQLAKGLYQVIKDNPDMFKEEQT